MKLSQVLALSLSSLKSNRLRTLLTVLGIVVGIFSIIVIMTIITMLQSTIEEGVSFLSKNTFQVSKFPAVHTGGPGSWQKYRNREDITMEDFYRLEKLLVNAKYVGAEQGSGGKIVKWGSKETNPNIYVVGVTTGAFKTYNVTIKDGRELRETDVEYSNDVCILGNDVTEKVFGSINPVGKIIRVDGKPLQVIAILEPQPKFFGQSQDNYIVMPLTKFQAFYGKRSRSISITIMSNSKADYDATIESTI